jgi:hypothetical protein
VRLIRWSRRIDTDAFSPARLAPKANLSPFPPLTTLTTSFFPSFHPQVQLVGVEEVRGTIHAVGALTRRRPNQAMISAIIILSLLSLLVATEPEPAESSAHPVPEPPLRPLRRKSSAEVAQPQSQPEPERLAA